MKLIFLDIDGVLNTHEKLQSNYCGIGRQQAGAFNRVLATVPDALVVISSAWRYLVLNGSMTIRGFERMLLTHGLCAEERIYGVTCADPITVPREKGGAFDVEKWKAVGLRWRGDQIREYLDRLNPAYVSDHVVNYVVIDDLPLKIDNLVQTDAAVGFTESHADAVIALLG